MSLRFKDLSVADAAEKRMELLEAKAGTPLPHLRRHSIDPETANQNVENFAGAVQVPLGIAGPLQVDGVEYWIPLATTEKGLVAGVNRGCKVLNLCGGVRTQITNRGMTRAATFECRNIRQATELVEWANRHYAEIKRRVEGKSRFIRLAALQTQIVGRSVYLKFKCYTGDAMGMEMVTAGSDRACEWIAEQTHMRLITISGNMCVDKKPAALNLEEGRGRSVIAEGELVAQTVLEVLHQSPEQLQQVNYSKHVGSAMSGSFGFNAHFANIVAAMYIATGQDPAQVVSGSLGATLIESLDDGFWHVSVTMPCLETGTVGGGTGRETPREVLRIMGLEGGAQSPGANADRLAQVIAAATLAGELSLLAKLCRL
jgi:hydroxymethylglutaryl-CoA reductase (NADPH)